MINRKRNRRGYDAVRCLKKAAKSNKRPSSGFVSQMLRQEDDDSNQEFISRLTEAAHGLGVVSQQLEDLQLLVEDWIDVINEVIEEVE